MLDIQDIEIVENHAEPQPRLDIQRGVFVTSRGDEIELSGKAITSLMLERVQSQGKPRIPKVEVTLLAGTKHEQKQVQLNDKDPAYLAELAEWESEQKIAVLRYIFCIGAKGQPPQEFVDEQRVYFPNATELEMKYLWVASRLPDDDIDDFTEVVLGRSIATAKGLDEAANFTESA